MSERPTAARRYRTSRRAPGLLAVVLLLGSLAYTAPAQAQCGAKESTCAACHDGARAAYAADARWHADHCFASVCAVCHGGVPDAPLAAAAHVGLVPPLGQDAAQCASCHGASNGALAQRYAILLPGDAHADADAGAPATPRPPARLDAASNDGPAAIVAVLLGLVGLGWVVTRERVALRRWRDSWMPTPRTSPPDDRS